MSDIRLTKRGGGLLALWQGRRRQHGKLSALFMEADALRDEKDWLGAALKYRQIVDSFPTEVAAAIQLGHAYKELGRYAEAAQAYEAARDVTPTDDDLHLQIGHLHKVMGRLPAAAASYHKALELNPANTNAATEFEAVRSHWQEQSAPKGFTESGGISVVDKKPKELRRLGDAARDGKAWQEAVLYYEGYLRSMPKDAGIWVQLGHCRKEGGDLAGGEEAYRRALQISPGDPDPPLHLGHVLKLQNRLGEAAEAYRRSFALKPVCGVADELRRLSPSERLEISVEPKRSKDRRVYVDVSDLLDVMTETVTVSGIQRVQVGLLDFLVQRRNSKPRCEIVFWRHESLWQLPEDMLPAAARAFENAHGDLGHQQRAVHSLWEKSTLLHPNEGDIYVSTGVLYRQPKLAARLDKLKQAKVRLGIFVHDFIPLTHQELIDSGLTLAFSRTMAEALPQVDFILTNSDHVTREVQRLRRLAKYPEVPVRTVALAHSYKNAVVSADKQSNDILEELAGREFVLCVGTMSAHKNQELLVNAWRLLLEQDIEVPVLVLAGRKGHDIERMMKVLHQTDYLNGHVQVIEEPSDEEVESLYRNCLFTAFPSFVEGWGLPVGESLARGKLCVASETTSMPQVGGDFAIYVDPYNVRATADTVRQLILDREEIRRREKRIRDLFKPRTLDEFAEDFLRTLVELGQVGNIDLLLSPESRILRPQLRPHEWPWGNVFPPYATQVEEIAGRLMLSHGWCDPEFWGTWIDGSSAEIRLRTGSANDRTFRVVLQFWTSPWARHNTLCVQSACGAETTVVLPNSGFTETTWPAGGTRERFCKKILVSLDCLPDADGYVTLSLKVGGHLAPPWWGERRSIHVGLVQLVFQGLDNEEIAPEQAKLSSVSSVAPTLVAGRLPLGIGTLASVLSRRHVVLGRGWYTIDQGTTWITSREGRFVIRSRLEQGDRIDVAAKVRNVSRQGDALVEIRSTCGASSEGASLENAAAGVLRLSQCLVGKDGAVELDLRVDRASPFESGSGKRQKNVPSVELQSVAYVASNAADGRFALAEALAFEANSSDEAKAIRKLARQDLRFVVAGHIQGSYSLAAVNRQLAFALEKELPGAIRVLQIEGGRPTRNLVEIPPAEKKRILPMIARQPSLGSREIFVSQHWPYWVPDDTAIMKIALVPWEESLLPEDLVRTLNQQFDCVFVHTTFVQKALIDSGVVTPIKHIGMPLDLERFLEIGEARKNGRAAAGRSNEPFTFLHVSSCFPRKGADVLLKAYAEEFSSSDKVKLVVKTFPNPHNDIAEQIAKLRAANPKIAGIQLINEDLAFPDLARLYADSDAMVLPARGEGFNLGAVEALAAGLHLIVTGWGAHLDFANASNARLIDFSLVNSSAHVSPPWSVWAEPSVEDLRRAMREAVDSRNSSEAGIRQIKGMETARKLSTGGTPALKVVESALDVAFQGEAYAPKIAWISSWNIRCGLATHSHLMLEHLRDAHSRIVLLCDDRTEASRLHVPNMPDARVAWKKFDSPSVEGLASEIAVLQVDAVVIQHQRGLISFTDLAKLLEDQRTLRCHTVVELHNVRELFDVEELEGTRRLDIVKGLAMASRLLVHSIRDLNLMKQLGLVDNVTLLPVGVTGHMRTVPVPRVLPRDAAPLLGTYGFFLPQKNFEVLLHAFVRVKREWPRARLRFVTAEFPEPISAREIQKCKTLADALGIANSIDWHTDFLDDESSLQLLSTCDLLILPYKEVKESASGAVRVALASRVPVAVTPVGIFDDVGEAVTRFDGQGVDDIANGIIKLLDQPTFRGEQQQRTSKWLRENSWERSAKRLLAIVQALATSS